MSSSPPTAATSPVSPKRASVGASKRRSTRDHSATSSSMSKNRSATTTRNPSPLTQLHRANCSVYRTKDLESSSPESAPEWKYQGLSGNGKKTRKDIQMHDSKPMDNMDRSVSLKDAELRGKQMDKEPVDCPTYNGNPYVGKKTTNGIPDDRDTHRNGRSERIPTTFNGTITMSRSRELVNGDEMRSPKWSSTSMDEKMNRSATGQQGYDKYSSDITDLDTLKANRKAKKIEFETSTIAKQRAELQLLITELKDRDRELNEMVLAHQRQIAGWDADRKKIEMLEQRNNHYEKEMEQQTNDLRNLVAKLNTVTAEEQNKATALASTKKQLTKVTEEHSQEAHKHSLLQEKYNKLKGIIEEQDDHITQMESREHEVLALLKMKDKDLSEATSNVVALSGKVQRLEEQVGDAQRQDSELRRQVSEWKNKQKEVWKEYEHAKREIVKRDQVVEDYKSEVQRLRQDVQVQKKEIMLAGERERRITQLLELGKSKQERTESELSHLRNLYERQQKDMSLLQFNLENTKDLLVLHQRQTQPNTAAYTTPANRATSSSTTDQQNHSSSYSTKEAPHISYSQYSSKPSAQIPPNQRDADRERRELNDRERRDAADRERRGDTGRERKETDEQEFSDAHAVLPEPTVNGHDTSATTEDSYMARYPKIVAAYGDDETTAAEESDSESVMRGNTHLEESFVSDVTDDGLDGHRYSSNAIGAKRSYTIARPATESYIMSKEAGLSHHDAAEIDRILAKHLGNAYKGGSVSTTKGESAPVIGEDAYKITYAKESYEGVTASEPSMSREYSTENFSKPHVPKLSLPVETNDDEEEEEGHIEASNGKQSNRSVATQESLQQSPHVDTPKRSQRAELGSTTSTPRVEVDIPSNVSTPRSDKMYTPRGSEKSGTPLNSPRMSLASPCPDQKSQWNDGAKSSTASLGANGVDEQADSPVVISHEYSRSDNDLVFGAGLPATRGRNVSGGSSSTTTSGSRRNGGQPGSSNNIPQQQQQQQRSNNSNDDTTTRKSSNHGSGSNRSEGKSSAGSFVYSSSSSSKYNSPKPGASDRTIVAGESKQGEDRQAGGEGNQQARKEGSTENGSDVNGNAQYYGLQEKQEAKEENGSTSSSDTFAHIDKSDSEDKSEQNSQSDKDEQNSQSDKNEQNSQSDKNGQNDKVETKNKGAETKAESADSQSDKGSDSHSSSHSKQSSNKSTRQSDSDSHSNKQSPKQSPDKESDSHSGKASDKSDNASASQSPKQQDIHSDSQSEILTDIEIEEETDKESTHSHTSNLVDDLKDLKDLNEGELHDTLRSSTPLPAEEEGKKEDKEKTELE